MIRMVLGFIIGMFGLIGFTVELENYQKNLVWDWGGLGLVIVCILVGLVLFYSGKAARKLKKQSEQIAEKKAEKAIEPSVANPEEEEKIQEAIRNRVFELNQKQQEKEKLAEASKVNLDVLEEMTDVPREEIEKIANEVRLSFTKNKKA